MKKKYLQKFEKIILRYIFIYLFILSWLKCITASKFNFDFIVILDQMKLCESFGRGPE